MKSGLVSLRHGSGWRTETFPLSCSASTSKENGISDISYINYGEDDQMEIYGYRRSQVKTAITWIIVVVTAGLLRLVFHWYPHWFLLATHELCSLSNATELLVVDNYLGKFKTYFVKRIKEITTDNGCDESVKQLHTALSQAVRIQLSNGNTKEVQRLRIVRIKKLTYVWDDEREEFIKLAGMDKGLTKSELHQFEGYNEYQQLLRRAVYGCNEIPVEVQSLMKLFLLEVVNPFYIFQLFSLCVWLSEEYYYYAIAIVLMSAFGITTTIIQTRKNQKSLRDTVQTTDTIMVWRGQDQYEDLPTNMLVPGDVICIPPHGCDMHCDAVLLSGTCIVNESMLTGESIPVNKTSLPRQSQVLYHQKEDANHTLFCGTRVIQARFYGTERVRAVVLRTGFLTAKGSLVRAILYPPPADYRFDQDSYKFIGILAVIAGLGFIYTVVLKVGREIAASDVVIKALDLITIVIPPALPAALSVGKMYAQKRLQARGIFCINSKVINVSGSLDCVCFDKTGTLTEDGLDMWGSLPASPDKESMLEQGMACCHSLTLIEGELIGDPLDVKMFEATGWTLEEPEVADQEKYDLLVPTVVKHDDIEIGIVHQFHFSSTLQRMSVVTRTLGSQNFVVYCKGSPEMIASLCRPDTVPSDWNHTLQKHTEKGYRVIAMGSRTLPDIKYTKIKKMHRQDAEQDLEFLGLIVLENRLKPKTTETIQVLKDAKFKILMITGDNILTAVSVAKECGIIAPGETVVDVSAVPGIKDSPAKVYYTTTHGRTIPLQNGGDMHDMEAGLGHDQYKLALTGTTWSVLRNNFPDLVARVCTRGAVFARMSSEQKQQVVSELQALGHCVAMCGDGANDCGALRAAHVGISLSEAECSVASPFTARDPSIDCVPSVLREGRAALSTSSGVFRFMVAYSLTEFLSCIILYAENSNLTDLQFLFIDLALIVNFACSFGLTKAYDGPLDPSPPLTTLLSFIPLASITLHMLVIAAIQTAAFYIVKQFSWYPYFHKDPDSYTCYENYAVYAVSLFQYIASVVVFSQGKPYRQEIYTNKTLMASLVVMTCVCAYKILYPPTWILSSFHYILPPAYDFRVIILCLAVVNFIVVIFAENIVVEYLLDKVVRPIWKNVTGLGDKDKKFLVVEKQLLDERWPPLTREAPPTLAASVTELREPLKTVDIHKKKCNGENTS